MGETDMSANGEPHEPLDTPHSSPRGPCPASSNTHIPSSPPHELRDGDDDDAENVEYVQEHNSVDTHEPDKTASQSKRKRTAVYLFSETQEVEFYKENELFYNKKLKNYKNSEKKQRLHIYKGISFRSCSIINNNKTFWHIGLLMLNYC